MKLLLLVDLPRLVVLFVENLARNPAAVSLKVFGPPEKARGHRSGVGHVGSSEKGIRAVEYLEAVSPRHSIDDDLRRNGVETGQHIPLDWVIFNDSFDHHGSSVDVLYLLGGRASIVHWLRLQGENPLIFNAAGSEALYANIFRKQKMFEKSMTLVAIHPVEQVPVSGGSWTVGRPVDLMRSPLSPRRDKAEFMPTQLGRVLEWIFVNTPG